MKLMDLSTSRRRKAWVAAPIIALAATIGATFPVLSKRMGPDTTAITPKSLTGRSFTIVGAGDILVHPPTWQQAQKDSGKLGGYDFDKIFSRVKPVISSADLALCHMEAPMGPGQPRDFPKFNAPIPLAATVKNVGFDGCSTASNHSLDQGENGLAANLAALDAQGLGHTGTARTTKEALTPRIYTVNTHGGGTVKVGHLSYAYGLNRGTSTPPGKKWMANILERKRVLAAAAATKRAGADVVILSAHWGIEKVHEANQQQLTLARAFLASPNIDAIIGHHAHVVQPAEKINNKWVFYGVGNLLARHDFPTPDNKEGVLPRLTFAQGPNGKWTTSHAEAIPIWLGIEPDVRIFNLPHSLAVMSDVDRRRAKYAAAYERIRGYLGERGAYAAGLRLVAAD
jgi:hypothetical protein